MKIKLKFFINYLNENKFSNKKMKNVNDFKNNRLFTKIYIKLSKIKINLK